MESLDDGAQQRRTPSGRDRRGEPGGPQRRDGGPQAATSVEHRSEERAATARGKSDGPERDQGLARGARGDAVAATDEGNTSKGASVARMTTGEQGAKPSRDGGGPWGTEVSKRGEPHGRQRDATSSQASTQPSTRGSPSSGEKPKTGGRGTGGTVPDSSNRGAMSEQERWWRGNANPNP